jgi:hypothetical protein
MIATTLAATEQKKKATSISGRQLWAAFLQFVV